MAKEAKSSEQKLRRLEQYWNIFRNNAEAVGSVATVGSLLFAIFLFVVRPTSNAEPTPILVSIVTDVASSTATSVASPAGSEQISTEASVSDVIPSSTSLPTSSVPVTAPSIPVPATDIGLTIEFSQDWLALCAEEGVEAVSLAALCIGDGNCLENYNNIAPVVANFSSEICLLFLEDGKIPTPSLNCQSRTVITIELSPVDVFWLNQFGDLQPLQISYDGLNVHLCSNNAAASCQFEILV